MQVRFQLALGCAFALAVAAGFGGAQQTQPVPPAPRGSNTAGTRTCPADMVHVEAYCVDRWEIATVDAKSGEKLSPYYPPDRTTVERIHQLWQVERSLYSDSNAQAMPLPDLPAWQAKHDFSPRAVSRPSVVPQGYLTYYSARRACEAAGKRLCTRDEWVRACKGESRNKFPYGASYQKGKCNVDRLVHPAAVLHGASWFGHTDPRLNLVLDGSDPLLHLTGQTPDCASRWGDDKIYDMVGNLDEWIDDDSGVFVGGFYARSTTQGCESVITTHAPVYFDYSLGTRCCLSP